MIAPIVGAAVEYARRGWSVMPVRSDKRPTSSSWKERQTIRALPEDIPAWFGRSKSAAGVGIVLGPVSGNLYARDFDDPAEYHRWREAHPDWAARLPTVRTRRGFHVYGRWAGVRTAKVAGGELRAEGAYVVAPPSRNAEGGVYGWLVPLPEGDVPEVDPFVIGLAVAGEEKEACATERTEKTETSETTERTESTEDTEDTKDPEAIWGNSDTRAKIESAIARTQPTGFGGRNDAVFRFARALKAIPALRAIPNTSIRRLRPIVKVWHARAMAKILTKDWATTWGDFGHAWTRVRTPEGEDVLGDALRAAEQADPPAWTEDYSPQSKLLASLCRELQRRAGDSPFFLSAAKAGECVGVDKGTAARWLKAFIFDGALKLVEAGTASSRKASRYRYVARDADDVRRPVNAS